MVNVFDGVISVLKGGPGSEREVSLRSAASVSAALKRAGMQVREVDVASSDWQVPGDMEFAFNMIHGTFGEDGQVQALLEAAGVPYTGEGVEGSRKAFDKFLTKECFDAKGIPTASWEVLELGQQPRMQVPLVLKAPCQGSSVGVYIVKDAGQLEAAMAGVREFTDRVLVEKFVVGRELTVGILGDRILPIVEILTPDGVYDFRNKYPWLTAGGASEHLCPAPLDEALAKKVGEVALAAHRALGLEVYSRVDVLLPDTGEPIVLEVNTIPGMTESSLLPDAAKQAGIDFEALCTEIVSLSQSRFSRRKQIAELS
ncbi:MAG: D-alanine--D-alanine ligase [Verrucomicrobiales bacterium]